MPEKADKHKKTISITSAESASVAKRSTDLGCSENEYMRRLIGIGSVISKLGTNGNEDRLPNIQIELIARDGQEVVDRHIISDLYL